MVVSVKESWKIPIAYFLIDGLSGIERANIVKLCIRKLHDVGVKVISLICDGPSCHLTMMSSLGANLDPLNLKTYFEHPLIPSQRVYVLLDVCHMLKVSLVSLSLLKVSKVFFKSWLAKRMPH